MKNAFIVFCSPARTGHVARVIADALEGNAAAIHLLDLGAGEDPAAFLSALEAADSQDCLFVGSPVYRDLAVPLVVEFFERLPAADGCPAVPFVTWGGANSGIALWQMGQALQDQGYALVGGAKVLGVHSMMWPCDQPVGQGHPDADDDRQVRKLVEKVMERAGTTPGTVALSTFDYQSETIGADMKKKLGQPWMIIPKSVDEEACTQCGICGEVCPVGAVALDPGPIFGERCFDCFNCIRECPEDAITPAVPLSKIEEMIRQRVETFNERPHTQIFL